MSKLFPIQVHRRGESFLATTSVEKLVDDPDRVNAELRDLAGAYADMLTAARAEFDAARRDPRERTRGYWRIGQMIREFEAALHAAGYYLPAQTKTWARDLGMHEGSLRKILAFHRRNSDAGALDPRVTWNVYRERRSTQS